MKTSLLLKCGVAILLACGYAQAAQSQSPQVPKVRGHVYDENKNRLESATITLKEIGLGGPGTPFAFSVSQSDGSFEIDPQTDSVLLEVSWLGYIPVKMKVPRDCEVDIYMEPDPAWRDDIIVGDPPAIPSRLRTGYILNAQKKPIYGASIVAKGDGNNTTENEEVLSDLNGSFKIRATDFAILTINVEGHEPAELDLKDLKNKGKSEESMRIEHDGLFIVIDFNW